MDQQGSDVVSKDGWLHFPDVANCDSSNVHLFGDPKTSHTCLNFDDRLPQYCNEALWHHVEGQQLFVMNPCQKGAWDTLLNNILK